MKRTGKERPNVRKKFFSKNEKRPGKRKERDARPKTHAPRAPRSSVPHKRDRQASRNDAARSFSRDPTPTKQSGLFRIGRGFFTKNAQPGKVFFDMERELRIGKDSYREVDPKRSKFVAAIAKGLQQTGLFPDSIVLYLGASHGYTPSFFSDIVTKGMLFCVDLAPRVVRDLWFVCEQRENMAPILASASDIEAYEKLVPKTVDVVYQDIAQRDQVAIFLRNCDQFLKQGGTGMIAIKARSIDVTAHPRDLFKRIRRELEEHPGYHVIEYRELDPHEKDHAFFVIKKK